MARIGVTMQMKFDRCLDALEAAAKDWPQETKDTFAAEWKAMEAEGAQMVYAQLIDGCVTCFPHEDFMRHLESYGVHLW